MDKECKKKKLKKMALKGLIDDNMDEMSPVDGKIKATIIADSKEDLMKGVKELPKVLSEAEKYMNSRMSDLKKSPKKKKS